MLDSKLSATFLLKVSGDSMVEAGILPGDMVLIDKAQVPKSGDIVIAEVDGAWTMKYLRKRGESVALIPANPRYKPIKPQKELRIAGVVTAVVRKYGSITFCEKHMDNQPLTIHSWPRAILHLDADAFFTSCEQAGRSGYYRRSR